MALLLVAGLAGCVTPAAILAERTALRVQMPPTMVTVGTRDYLGGVSAGPPGLVLTPQGAEAVTGASVSVFRPGLGNADGIEAKAAAAGICAQAGGRYDPAAVGRFVPSDVADGSWVFDGACG
jgi:hypothetical protein